MKEKTRRAAGLSRRPKGLVGVAGAEAEAGAGEGGAREDLGVSMLRKFSPRLSTPLPPPVPALGLPRERKLEILSSTVRRLGVGEAVGAVAVEGGGSDPSRMGGAGISIRGGR
jgi:hypothetical protein